MPVRNYFLNSVGVEYHSHSPPRRRGRSTLPAGFKRLYDTQPRGVPQVREGGHRAKKKAAPSGAASFMDLEMVLS